MDRNGRLPLASTSPIRQRHEGSVQQEGAALARACDGEQG
jgi:hypothetical protein